MTPDEIAAALAAARTALADLQAGKAVAAVRTGEDEVKYQPGDAAALRQRIAELEAMQSGRPARVRAVRPFF